MACPSCRDELSDARAAQVAAHLDACVRCGLEADSYRRVRNLIPTG